MSRHRTHMYGRSPVSINVSVEQLSRQNQQSRAKLTSQKMPLEMLGVQVRLVTMRARELPVGILLGDLVLCRLAASDRGLGPTRRAREDSSATLRANHMCRRVAFLLHHLRLGHQWALRVWRRHAALRDHATRGHWTQYRGGATTRRRGRNRLRVGHCGRCLGHH